MRRPSAAPPSGGADRRRLRPSHGPPAGCSARRRRASACGAAVDIAGPTPAAARPPPAGPQDLGPPRHWVGRFSAKLGPKTFLERRGSSCSAGCTKNHPPRPFIRPFRDAKKCRRRGAPRTEGRAVWASGLWRLSSHRPLALFLGAPRPPDPPTRMRTTT